MLERRRKKGGHGGMGFAFQISEDFVPAGVIAQQRHVGRPRLFQRLFDGYTFTNGPTDQRAPAA